ncbi:cell division cycle 25 homolog d [Erpetoichthys calabaricus]|uniref:cell division cycle 25 homolog d n=1 Tax=Erpetoichthys calabaricus TaxID=27687 RepID=UPI0022344738|nr:cell division cycle 25 homolog d [Erpetoichthys calabaricus]
MVKREKKCQRRKTTSQGKNSETYKLQPKRQLSPGSILDAAEKEGNLIGDFSKPYLLQLEKGDHQDLQYVSSHVVASLLKGEYDSTVKKYQIIDCRYPYEYEGGHIKGATNIYNEAQLQAAMFQEVCQSPSKNSYVDGKELTEKISLQSPPSRCTFGNSPTSTYLLQDSQHSANTEQEDFAMSVKDQSPSAVSSSYDASAQRTLIIFYCEFSSERGPRICRHLRKIDRNVNVYPQLYYPELYILKGGYKEFYSQFKSLCEPCSYMPMLHKDFSEQLRRYRRKRRFRSVQFRRKQLFESETDVQ